MTMSCVLVPAALEKLKTCLTVGFLSVAAPDKSVKLIAIDKAMERKGVFIVLRYERNNCFLLIILFANIRRFFLINKQNFHFNIILIIITTWTRLPFSLRLILWLNLPR